MQRLFTARQAGQYLGFTSPRSYIHELYKRGKFPEPEIMLDDGERGKSKFWTEEQLKEYQRMKGCY